MPPAPNRTPSCRPAVPPPPVSGAAVGNAVPAGADECVGAEECVGADVAAWVCVAVGELEACAELDARAELDACAELDEDAWGEPEAEAPPRAVEVALEDELEELEDDLDACPVGDGVRVPAPVEEECPPVGAVGVKIDGTEEPPLVQAETVTARSTAPAAERPAISHAPWAATGGVRRIFMNPPRMRVRIFAFPSGAPPGYVGSSPGREQPCR